MILYLFTSINTGRVCSCKIRLLIWSSWTLDCVKHWCRIQFTVLSFFMLIAFVFYLVVLYVDCKLTHVAVHQHTLYCIFPLVAATGNDSCRLQLPLLADRL